MTLPVKFRKQDERALASFDFVDIASGTGYETYFGIKGDAAEHVMTPIQIDSEEIASFIQDQSITLSFVKLFDLDFDIKFNLPRNIKGKLYASIPIGMAATTSETDTFVYYASAIAKHFDGSTETTLATGTSREVTDALATGAKAFTSMNAFCICDITTLRHFKKDETLRVTVEGYFKTTEGAPTPAHVIIGHDPKNKNFKGGSSPENINAEIELANEVTGGGSVIYTPTQMAFQVPFRVDL